MEEEGFSYSQGIHRMASGSPFRWPDVLEVVFMGTPRCRDDGKLPLATA